MTVHHDACPGWMVGELGSFAVFAVFGLGLQVVIVAALMLLFRKWRWLSTDSSAPVRGQPTRTAVAAEHRWHLVHPHKLAGAGRPNGADFSSVERGTEATAANSSSG